MPEFLPDIHYKDGSNWLPLPDWCQALIMLGQALATRPLNKSRQTVALALPAHNYASVFAGVGVVLASVEQNRPISLYEEMIEAQPIGTSIIVNRGSSRLKGVIQGFQEDAGQKRIVIRVGNKDIRSYPLSSFASRIRIVGKEFNLSDYQNAQRLPVPSEVVRAVISNPEQFVSNTQLDAVFVAVSNSLEIETSTLRLGINSTRAMLEGNPQEILRIARFSGIEPYRTDLYPVSNPADDCIDPRIANPTVVVFADCTGYIKHNAKWPSAHHLILLDRTHRAFTDAASIVNQRFFRRSGDQTLTLNGTRFPSSAEVLAFEETIA